MLLPLDGPASQGGDSVGTVTPKELKVGSSALSDRDVVTLQAIDGALWVYFGTEGVTPSASDVSTKGFEHPKKALRSYEAGARQPIWVLAKSGTVAYRFAERG